MVDAISLENLWRQLYNDYQKDFGTNTDFFEYLANLKRLLIAEIDFALTQNRKLLNKIDILTEDINAYLKTLEGERIHSLKIVAIIEKYLGFSIDLNTCSVVRFYKYIELMNEEIEKNNTIKK